MTKFVRRYVAAHARTLVLLALLSGASAGVSVLLLSFLNERAADSVQQGGGMQAVIEGCVLLLAMMAVKALSAGIAAAFGSRLIAELRRDLSARFLALDVERLLTRRHAIFGALIEDVSQLAPLIQMAPQLLNNLLLSVLGIGYLVHLSPFLSAVVLPFIALSAALFFGTQRWTRGSFDEMRGADESLFGLMRTLVEGKKELTLVNARARHFENTQLAPAIERARKAQWTTGIRWGVVDACGEALSYAWVLAAILAGALWLGESRTVILQFVIAGLFLSGPINSLFDLGTSVSGGLASLRHLARIGLELDREIEPAPPEPPAVSDWQRIRLEGVGYAYPDSNATGYRLGPLDLEISRGETLFIGGGNGSGKSTLLLLLAGLLTPTEGCLKVDGQPVEGIGITGQRRRCSAVFFDFMLFPHVIDADGEAADPEAVQSWLKRVDMESKVDYRDGQLSTVDLSQGQRKRLAFVQCCLDDRDIMIFDELTADQDRSFREKFYLELLPQLKRQGKTLVVVTHDDRYWHCADRVITLEYGRLREAAATQAERSQASEVLS